VTRAEGGGDQGHEQRWVALATAPDQPTAELWLALLREQGIPAMLNPGDVTSFLGTTLSPVRVMVPERLAAAAREALEAPEDPDDAPPSSNGHGREAR